MEEEWRKVPGLPDYSVSSLGRVRRDTSGPGTRAGTIIAGSRNIGYKFLMCPDRKYRGIHRLVALAFLGPPPSPKSVVAHNDGVRDNNVVSNLRWATQAENLADRKLHGTANTGEANGRAKLKEHQVKEILRSDRKCADLAKKYGVKPESIKAVKAKRTWAYLHEQRA